jgi:hypothetical protein
METPTLLVLVSNARNSVKSLLAAVQVQEAGTEDLSRHAA